MTTTLILRHRRSKHLLAAILCAATCTIALLPSATLAQAAPSVQAITSTQGAAPARATTSALGAVPARATTSAQGAALSQHPIGIFDDHLDIGHPRLAGDASYD